MDYHKLKRDPAKVHATLKDVKGEQLYAMKPCKVIIPGRYLEQQLAVIASEVYTLGIFALVVGDHYAVSLTPAMMRVEPTSTNYVTYNDEEYVEFLFDAGAVVFPNLSLVKKDALLYDINEEIINKGKIPWFLSYDDLGSLFDHSKEYAGASLANNDAVLEMITATIARDKKDLTKFYRQTVKVPQDKVSKEPEFVALNNTALGASNTTAKLMGNYFGDALTSALVNPSEKSEDIETILRK